MAIRNHLEAELTPREWAQYNHDKEMLEIQINHATHMKQLDLEIERLNIKWATWIKIPLVIITLPVRVLFIIPLTVYAITHQEVPEFYRKFLG